MTTSARAIALVALLAGLLPGVAGSLAADSPRHLLYLHGRIIQDQQSRRPEHPEWGIYELDKILDTFRGRGFVVHGEVRPKDATVSASADRVVTQVRELLGSGVPADRILVVGGSMGGAITLLASARLGDPSLRFAVLGPCLTRSVPALQAEEGQGPRGRVLSIREASDELSEPCPAWEDEPGAEPGLVVREIVLETGLHHGFLYRPLPEWVEPVVEWTAVPVQAGM